MTWMGDFKLNQCFIERQHTISDSIGQYIEPENFELGDYVDEDTIRDFVADHEDELRERLEDL